MVLRILGTAARGVAIGLALAGAAAGSEPVRVLAPLDGGVVHVPEVLLVYTVPTGTATAVQVGGNLLPLRDVPVPGDSYDLHHARVPLDEGYCDVRVLDAASEAELARVNVCYVPPHSRRTPVKEGTRPYAFHTREGEAACSDCHNLPGVFETEAGQPLAPAGKVCGACHPGIEAAPNLHGPTAVYACFTCHEPAYQPARFSQKQAPPALCSTCHEGFLAKVLGGRKFVHGPVATGACLACHEPHGGRSQALLREAVPPLCLVCHAETLPVPAARSLHAKVACTRCHDPHGGDTPLLTAKTGNAFCLGCHQGFADLEAGHPLPGHPVVADVDPSRPGTPLGCTSCHGPHGVDDVSKRNIISNEAAQRKFCIRCHY